MLIQLDHVTKIYRTNVKQPGLTGALKNLVHTEWNEKTAIDDVSFDIHEGQVLACIGENGAGLRRITYLTPFPYLVQFPISIFLGQELLVPVSWVFLIQSAWIGVLLIAHSIIFGHIRRNMNIAGG